MKTIQKLRNAAVKAENIDDIIFEGRNLEYGAYVLRKDYSTHLVVSVLAVFVFAVLVAGIPSLFRNNIQALVVKEEKIIQVKLEDFYTKPEPPPQKSLDPLASIDAKSNKYAPIVVDVATETEQMLTDADKLADEPFIEEPGNEGVLTELPPAGEIETEKIFEPWQVKEEAIFKDGKEDNFRIWLAKNIDYPEDALSGDIKGTVTLKFAINEEGNITDIVVMRGIHYLIDEAAIKAVKKSPRWIPAKIDGNPVKVYFYVPIIFNIQN